VYTEKLGPLNIFWAFCAVVSFSAATTAAAGSPCSISRNRFGPDIEQIFVVHGVYLVGYDL
jgi:hypothetical protein